MQSFALAVAVGASLVAAQQQPAALSSAAGQLSSAINTASSGASAFMGTATMGSAAASPLPTAISPEQLSAIQAAFSSYDMYLESNAYVNSLGSAMKSWLPRGSWDNFNGAGFHSQLTVTTDYLSLATGVPHYVYPSWVTGLPGSLQSAWGAFATSVQLAHESIVRNELSIAGNPNLPADTAGVVSGPTPTSNDITSDTNNGAGAVKTAAPLLAAGLAGLAAFAL